MLVGAGQFNQSGGGGLIAGPPTAKRGPGCRCAAVQGAIADDPALKPGDLILSVDGKGTANLADLEKTTAARLDGQEAGVDTIVEFEREGQLLATVVELGKEPNESDSTAAQRAWIGLSTQVITRDLAKALGIEGKKGVRITQVIPGSKAEEAEFQKGDLLLRMDGAVIRAERERDADVFDNMIREYPSDATVEFDIVRGGEAMKVECDLQVAPKPAKEFRKLINKTLEFTVREAARDNAEEAEITEGIYVDSVERAGWASLAGLSGGDVILSIDAEPMNSLDMVEKMLDRIEDERRDFIVLKVKRGKLTYFLEIHPIWGAQ